MPVMAFSGNRSGNKNTFVVTNTNLNMAKPLEITIRGTESLRYRAFRTTGNVEKYKDIGEFSLSEGRFLYTAPSNSVTTFFSID